VNRFRVKNLPLLGLKLVERKQLGDSRGFISRLYCSEEFTAAGWHQPIAQINQTITQKQGTVRGLHYQVPPYAEMKLVSCLQGAIWDVVVDLRVDSPTFLHSQAVELSAANQLSLLIPEGFAHGFQTLTDNCGLIYMHSKEHVSIAEAGLNVNDPMLGIDWPMEISNISDRDEHHPMIDNLFKGVQL
jgi:dTDP-4-dehydrorhamnose 3,5-epimerase